MANTLLGSRVFETKRSTESITITCSKGRRKYGEIELIVVDTPGLFSADRSQEEIATALAACTQAVLPGPHAFLLVLRSCDRFTEEDRETVNWMTNRFGKDQHGKNALDYSVVVFTHTDLLDDNETFDDFVKQSKDKPIGRIISACGNRCYGVNNKEKQENIQTQYLNDLIQIINCLIEKNHRREYVPPLMSDIAQLVQKRYKESHGQFKYIDPDGPVIPLPEAVRAVNEFYRLQQQQQNRQNRLEPRHSQQERQGPQHGQQEEQED